jgi:hypothetical protein
MGIHHLAKAVAVSPVHDRHQGVVPVKQAPVLDQPLPHGAVVGRH